MSVPVKVILWATVGVLLVPATVGRPTLLHAGDPVTDELFKEDEARQQILQSRRWRKLLRTFDDWMAVQKIYTPQQVSTIKARLKRQVSSMSAAELEDFMYENEERLEVLMSDEASHARTRLGFWTQEFRQKKLAQDGRIPNVFELSAGQLREELRQFQSQRAARSAVHSRESRLREQRIAAVEDERRSREEANTQARMERGAARFGTAQREQQQLIRTPYSPHRELFSRPSFYVSPWGELYRSLP